MMFAPLEGSRDVKVAERRSAVDDAHVLRGAACFERRNTHNAKADWRFTTADARVRLKSLCPSL